MYIRKVRLWAGLLQLMDCSASSPAIFKIVCVRAEQLQLDILVLNQRKMRSYTAKIILLLGGLGAGTLVIDYGKILAKHDPPRLRSRCHQEIITKLDLDMLTELQGAAAAVLELAQETHEGCTNIIPCLLMHMQ